MDHHARSSGDRPSRLLKPAEVAAMFSVDTQTVGRWADDGKLTAIKTLGGHRRYDPAEVRALLGTPSAA
ncbi:DNA-binding protein [Frankia sp. R43]|uniref:BldC family transcriptional regulator n=1 Tax=Frankia sp. R43 TaxID=269536 RepID=UPI0006CA03BF|nr:BldC family transcriptional regulator [Frankia sp. R43]KPM55676.1 DNA-binding protein [Frankia sp. R43]